MKGGKYGLNLVFEDSGDMFYNADSKEIIVKASRSISRDEIHLLYKLDRRGAITDSISISKSNVTPDCIIWNDYFSTWSCTGDTTKYPIQVETWSDFQDPAVVKLFETRYNKAKIVHFWFDHSRDSTDLMVMFGDGTSYQFVKIEIRTHDVWVGIDLEGNLEIGSVTYPPKSSLINY